MNVLCNFLLETVSLIVVEEVFGGHTENSSFPAEHFFMILISQRENPTVDQRI